MKILIATGIYPPQIGGPATYAKLLYDELPKRGFDIEVSTFGDYLDKPKVVRHFMYFMELVRRSADVDAIYALDPVSVGLPALFASQVRGKKFFLRIAGDYAWEQGTQRFGVTDILDDFARSYEKYVWQVRMLKKIEKYVADGADKIIVPSGYLKEIVSAWGVSPEKMAVVYNGFHIDALKETPSVLRKRLGLSGKVLVTVGRLVPWKGVKELIGIMSRIIAAAPDAKLLIIGDGPEMENLRKEAETSGVSTSISFLGKLEQKKLFEYVKAADLFVLNTSYEGFSHQIIETMALGTAVVTTRVGGNPEVIRDGENGVLVPSGAPEALLGAILSLLTDEKKAANMAKTARKDVLRFTDEAMLQNISIELRK